MRYLHLIDDQHQQGPPEGALAAIALLQQHDTGNEHLPIALLPPGDEALARHFGVTIEARLGISSLRSRSAAKAIEPIIDRLGGVDRGQAWSLQTRAVAQKLAGIEQPLPPAPPDPPIGANLLTTERRGRWRRALGITDDEIAITLIDQDPAHSDAGAFGLTIPPLTCAIQDRTIVGLIPGRSVSEGAERAARYAGNANDVWRIETVTIPRYAAAIAADAVLCPIEQRASQRPSQRWERWSSAQSALRCAQAMSIPIITGSFEGSQPITQPMGSAMAPTRPGRVGIVTALFDALNQPEPIHSAKSNDDAVADWIDRWRSSCRERAVVASMH